MLLLEEAQKLDQNMLNQGIVELLVAETPLLKMLPFTSINGNALAINREDTSNMGSVRFRAMNGMWTSDEAKFSQVTFGLHTLGGQADVPKIIQQSMTREDQMAAQVKIKTKLMGRAYEDQCVYGSDDVANGFDGLHAIMTAIDDDTQTLHAGSNATGGALTIALLDEALDNCRAGTPAAIMMNKAMRRGLTKYLRSVGDQVSKRELYGHQWSCWGNDEVPIVINDMMLSTETISDGKYSAKTGGATCSIFVLYFGEGDGVVGIQNGGIETETWERLESYDAARTRLKWYCGLATYSTLSCVRIDGINPATAVTA